MANFISLPTQIVGQPNVLFNKDNITAVVPPPADGTTTYCTLYSANKAYQVSFGGVNAAAKNTNSLAGAIAINNALTSANPAPVCSPVNFYTIPLANGAGATTTITVQSTSGLVVGMVVTVISGAGAFALNTTVASIIDGTQFTVSVAPTTALVNATIAASKLTVIGITPVTVAA